MASENRVGFLEAAYADERGAMRMGDKLHDIIVDHEKNTRLLGLIGRNDVTVAKSGVLGGSVPLAYLSIEQEGEIMFSHVTYGSPDVKIYGFDVNLTGVRQAIRIEFCGFTCLTVVTLNA